MKVMLSFYTELNTLGFWCLNSSTFVTFLSIACRKAEPLQDLNLMLPVHSNPKA